MNTIRLFKSDVYLKESTAVITSIKSLDNKTLLTFDRTIFFPVGGGQTCDTGTLTGKAAGSCTFKISDVYEYEDEILHEADDFDGSLAEGDEVILRLDWARRFDNMQRHCGEHILSGVFFELFGGVNRGFHMGDEYMTVDISLEAKPEFTAITWEMAKEAELMTNNVIWQNLPVVTTHFDTKEEAEKQPLRKALALEKDITIVRIGDPEKPADAVACCGTHPSHSGQVGMLKIYKVEPNKGMFRIYFEAGERAYRQYQQRFDILTELERDLSAGYADLLEKYNTRKEKTSALRDRLYHLSKATVAKEIEEIKKELSTGKYADTIFVKEYDYLTIDDLLEIAKGLEEEIPKIVFLVHADTCTALMLSDTLDCGKLIKENASVYGGKGGGRKTNARAIFPNHENLMMFTDAIEKLTR